MFFLCSVEQAWPFGIEKPVSVENEVWGRGGRVYVRTQNHSQRLWALGAVKPQQPPV